VVVGAAHAGADQGVYLSFRLHHVTAISGDPIKNLRFYTHDLGLRFVKKTVKNFDEPSTYHLYFGDETGRPGTILTFFPRTKATAGRRGVGEASQTAFRVPLGSIGCWTDRLTIAARSSRQVQRSLNAAFQDLLRMDSIGHGPRELEGSDHEAEDGCRAAMARCGIRDRKQRGHRRNVATQPLLVGLPGGRGLSGDFRK
jgi:catechol 2,3-dioxygenase-like lactoylglutathione lyase family enzyme